MKAIFCGDGMLLADCLEIFEKNGGQVMGIITSDANLQARAEEKSYALLGTPEKVAKDIPSVDFVFNIVNFKPLPNHLLDAAKSMAINVQGGLLPNYDGSNAASWALLAGEEEHGVTWYKIGTPDQVLKETVFDILPDDTAFTLETKGYQFAQESFSDLVADLVSGKIEVVRDVEKKTVYSENQKPARLGLLDFTQTSEVVSAQARALDFGLGENQLCLPKLWDGDQLLTVGAVNIGTETGNPSGYVISVEEGKIEVATSDGSIILSDLHSLSGKPTSSTMKAGDVITDCVIPNAENIGKNEPKWTKDLMAMTPCFPPHPTQHTNEEGYTEFDLRSNASGSELGAAWLAWCQLMSGQEALSLGLFAKQKSPLEASVLPLFLETSTSNKPADLISLLDKSIADANDRSPMASDLIVRQPSVSQDGMIRALSVILCETSKEVEQSSALIGLVSEGPKLVIKTGTFEPDVISAIESQFSDFLNLFLASSAPIETLPLVSVDSTENMTRSGDVFESSLRVHEAFEKQVKATQMVSPWKLASKS